jgi:hypothetical protein
MSVKVDAPGAIVDGKSISAWTKDWWSWIINGPLDPYNQSDDTTGSLSYINNQGPVLFLAGNNPFTGAASDANRYIVVQHGTPILVPVLNFIDIEGPGIPGSVGPDYKALVDKAVAGWLPTVNLASLHVSVDGKAIPDLPSHLETTDFFSLGTVQPGTLLTSSNIGVPAGAIMAEDKAAGYWVMLENLSKGAHTISFGGSTSNPEVRPVQITDHILVV